MDAKLKIVGVGVITAMGLFAADQAKKHFFCKYCGLKFGSVQSLTASNCQRHPSGPAKGRHALYEGSEKDQYTCKYCGRSASTINSLTSSKCQRHPNGPAKGNHEPTL